MNNHDVILFNSRDELLRIEVSKVVYFEADGNYTHVILANKLNFSVLMNLAKMEKVLADNLQERASRFMRIGKRFIVNTNYIIHVQTLKQRMVLSDGVSFAYSLNISKEELKNVKNVIVNVRL